MKPSRRHKGDALEMQGLYVGASYDSLRLVERHGKQPRTRSNSCALKFTYIYFIDVCVCFLLSGHHLLLLVAPEVMKKT